MDNGLVSTSLGGDQNEEDIVISTIVSKERMNDVKAFISEWKKHAKHQTHESHVAQKSKLGEKIKI